MGLLDKLGLKKKEEKKAEVKPEIKVAEKPVGGAAAVSPEKIDTGRAYEILLRPVISEKGTHLANAGRYVFAVHSKANKSEIKKSIQKVYDVHVEKVRIVQMPPKPRRYGRSRGRTSAWKKAVITVRSGEKIPGIIESVG